jgi:flagellar biosynthesis protein FliQ
MGPEIIYPISWFASVFAILWLAVRSISPQIRAFSLPTLVLSLVVGLIVAACNHRPGLFWDDAPLSFFPVVLILGIQAHAIRWLLRRINKASVA